MKVNRIIPMLVLVLTLALGASFVPMATATSTTTTATVDATVTVPSSYIINLQADTAHQVALAKKNEATANKAKAAYEKTVNQLGPFFKNVLVKQSSVLKSFKKTHDKAVKAAQKTWNLYHASPSTESTAMSLAFVTPLQHENVDARQRILIAVADNTLYTKSRAAINAAFTNRGHANLTSYRDGTRAFGDAAGDPSRRGKFFLLPGIGFFVYTDVGGAVHGTARADIYTPWAPEPCNNALAVFHAGGPKLYDFNLKKLGIKISASSFKSQKRRYESASAMHANHDKYGVYSK